MNIKLLAPHTHAGTDYQPGDVIEVDEASATWLLAHAVGETTRAAASPAPAPAEPNEGDAQ